jgi:hypothetical protein
MWNATVNASESRSNLNKVRKSLFGRWWRKRSRSQRGSLIAREKLQMVSSTASRALHPAIAREPVAEIGKAS